MLKPHVHGQNNNMIPIGFLSLVKLKKMLI
jgi:hypothetical protein